MIDYWDYYIYGYDYSGTSGIGLMTTLPVEEERDIVSELHDVVAEVTRKPSAPDPRQRIGFLP